MEPSTEPPMLFGMWMKERQDLRASWKKSLRDGVPGFPRNPERKPVNPKGYNLYKSGVYRQEVASLPKTLNRSSCPLALCLATCTREAASGTSRGGAWTALWFELSGGADDPGMGHRVKPLAWFLVSSMYACIYVCILFIYIYIYIYIYIMHTCM